MILKVLKIGVNIKILEICLSLKFLVKKLLLKNWLNLEISNLQSKTSNF